MQHHTPWHTVVAVTMALLALTGISAWMAESGARLPVPVGVIALAFAWIKGGLVAEHFMELRHAPWVLRSLVHGWLTVVCGGLLLVFL